MRSSALLLLVSLIAACSSAGGAPQEALSWEPGRYILEASISNPGVVNKITQYRAELAIGSDGATTMSSSSGASCQDLTPVVAGQDRLRGPKRFQCGPENYRLRPGVGTVIGDIEVPIEVEAVVTECVPVSNIDNRCAGGPDNSVRTTKQVRAQLRVRADR